MITQLERCLMIFKNGAKASGLGRAGRFWIAGVNGRSRGRLRRVDRGVGDFLRVTGAGLSTSRGVNGAGTAQLMRLCGSCSAPLPDGRRSSPSFRDVRRKTRNLGDPGSSLRDAPE